MPAAALRSGRRDEAQVAEHLGFADDAERMFGIAHDLFHALAFREGVAGLDAPEPQGAFQRAHEKRRAADHGQGGNGITRARRAAISRGAGRSSKVRSSRRRARCSPSRSYTPAAICSGLASCWVRLIIMLTLFKKKDARRPRRRVPIFPRRAGRSLCRSRPVPGVTSGRGLSRGRPLPYHPGRAIRHFAGRSPRIGAYWQAAGVPPDDFSARGSLEAEGPRLLPSQRPTIRSVAGSVRCHGRQIVSLTEWLSHAAPADAEPASLRRNERL